MSMPSSWADVSCRRQNRVLCRATASRWHTILGPPAARVCSSSTELWLAATVPLRTPSHVETAAASLPAPPNIYVRQRDTHRGTHTQRHREPQRGTEGHRETHTGRHRETQRGTEGQRNLTGAGTRRQGYPRALRRASPLQRRPSEALINRLHLQHIKHHPSRHCQRQPVALRPCATQGLFRFF